MFLHMLSEGDRKTFLKIASLFSVAGGDAVFEEREATEEEREASFFMPWYLTIEKVLVGEDDDRVMRDFKMECGIAEKKFASLDDEFSGLCQHDNLITELKKLPESARNSLVLRKEICGEILKEILGSEKRGDSFGKIVVFELLRLVRPDGTSDEVRRHLMGILVESLRMSGDVHDEVVSHFSHMDKGVRSVTSFFGAEKGL